jgi:ketosteroid isomerase-like protein
VSQEHAYIQAHAEAFYAAYNRRDWDAWLAEADSEIDWNPVEEDGSFSGRETLIRLAESWVSTWAQWEWTPEEIEIAPTGDLVFVAVRCCGRSKGSDALVEGYLFHVAQLRKGRFWRVREFTDRDEALTAFREAE